MNISPVIYNQNKPFKLINNTQKLGFGSLKRYSPDKDVYSPSNPKLDKGIKFEEREALLGILEELEIEPKATMKENLDEIYTQVKENSEKVKKIVRSAYLEESDTTSENLQKLSAFMQISIDKARGILRYFSITPSRDPVKNLEQIQNTAITDKLSGLYNKRALFHDLQLILDKNRGSDKPFSMVMFDMDNFKSVNDLLGYTTGDDFIKRIASKIKETSDKHKYPVYRFGGEEFIIMLPNVKKEDALPFVETIVHNLNNDENLNSHVEEYIKKGEAQIEKFSEKQKQYKYLLSEIQRLHYLEESAKIQQTKQNSSIKNQYAEDSIKEAEQSLQDAACAFLARSKREAQTSIDRELLEKTLSKVRAGERFDKIYEDDKSKELRTYLSNVYNYDAKIAEIHKWLDSVSLPDAETGKPRGFTISGGIKEFEGYEMAPEAYIDETGEVMKYAKRHLKGNVYYFDSEINKPKLYKKN